jgi:hypothetical protein
VSPEIRQSSEHYDQLRRDGYGVVHMDNVQSPEQAQERMQAWLKKSGYENGYPGTAHLILHDHGAKDGNLGSNGVPGDKMAVSIAKGLNTEDCRLGVSACYSGAVLDNLQRNGQMDQFTSAWSSSSNNETSRTYGNGYQTGEAAGRQHAQFLSDVANNRNLQRYDANRDGTILTSEMIGTMNTPGSRGDWEATTHWQHSQQQGWVPKNLEDPNADSRTVAERERVKQPDGSYVDFRQYQYSQTPQVGNDGVMYMSPQQPATQQPAQQPATQQPQVVAPQQTAQPATQPGTP